MLELVWEQRWFSPFPLCVWSTIDDRIPPKVSADRKTLVVLFISARDCLSKQEERPLTMIKMLCFPLSWYSRKSWIILYIKIVGIIWVKRNFSIYVSKKNFQFTPETKLMSRVILFFFFFHLQSFNQLFNSWKKRKKKFIQSFKWQEKRRVELTMSYKYVWI